MYAYSDFDGSEEGVQTKLYRLGIQAKHVVTKAPNKKMRTNASDIELSLDIQSFIYENPLINHYFIVSGDGDLLHVMQRLRLKGKTVHLIAFERVNNHLKSLADTVTIFDENAPFLNKITEQTRERLAERLNGNKDIEKVLYHLERFETEREFVSFAYFNRIMLEQSHNWDVEEAITKAKKAGLITVGSRPNPRNSNKPTSTIAINKDNPVSMRILSRAKIQKS